MKSVLDWFSRNGWTPFAFQRDAWDAYLAGKSGLVHAPTGSGKTLAVFLGPVIEHLRRATQTRPRTAEPFSVVWITPMRALANDTTHSLSEAIDGLGLNWTVQLRTSDTSAYRRKQQRTRLPTVLVTTPESLSVLLSYPDAQLRMNTLRCAIVDEWHELLSTKRGVQTELGLARLRHWNRGMRTWGLSATLGNLPEARDVLMGACVENAVMVHSELSKTIAVETALPQNIERFPWAGHLGLRMVPQVINAIEQEATTLVFTNTRRFAELWFRELILARPDWIGKIAIHHGSLDRSLRQDVEQHLRDGSIRAVVCTSSLDLGVDFPAVDQVIQIGSPKGIGRLMQRAGRSGHQPGRISRMLCVPTHAFELIEFSAAREGISNKTIEARRPLNKPLDVLVQHIVTVASGGGFDEQQLLDEVRTAHAYQNLTDQEWNWAMDFVTRGGPTLTAYPRFSRVTRQEGRWVVASEKLARMHRMGIGTIAGDGMMQVVTTRGRRLGTIEERFISGLRAGDRFVIAGKTWEFVRIHEMTAQVRPAKTRQGVVGDWGGTKFPLSTLLSDGIRARLGQARDGQYRDDEMLSVAPLLEIQRRWSRIPVRDELLIEFTISREGGHHFLYPFLGRLVHEGLGALLSFRITRLTHQPVTAAYTDYGIELLLPGKECFTSEQWQMLLSPKDLLQDLLECLNTGELARRQFREISRIAGLLMTSTPGAPRSMRQLQASAQLFYDVFLEFDPENLLLTQARREVLEQQLEVNRLGESLRRINDQSMLLISTRRLTPMAFPIWAQRISSQTVRVESAQDRIARMVKQLEDAALQDEQDALSALRR